VSRLAGEPILTAAVRRARTALAEAGPLTVPLLAAAVPATALTGRRPAVPGPAARVLAEATAAAARLADRELRRLPHDRLPFGTRKRGANERPAHGSVLERRHRGVVIG